MKGELVSEAPASHVRLPTSGAIVIDGAPDANGPPHEEVVHQIDDLDLRRFLPVAAAFGSERFGYVVTPNVDHFVRCHEDPPFRASYRAASYVLLDSRVAALLLRLYGNPRLPVCAGSDLLPALLAEVVAPTDRVLLIGGSARQADMVAERYGLANFLHHNPPMGFIRDPAALETCMQFIENASPFRFCFLAVGTPQQEEMALQLARRGAAKGLVLCVGAALNFLTGVEARAPRWMQQMALEWLYRLLRDPRRLARRYLVRGPRVFGHLRRARVVLRPTMVA